MGPPRPTAAGRPPRATAARPPRASSPRSPGATAARPPPSPPPGRPPRRRSAVTACRPAYGLDEAACRGRSRLARCGVVLAQRQ
ncbi:hypothetical protein StrepF001_01255 [Streptomyces sp. F001]|nr:hypothetical protein StrepF001_01255 [Streptomyces sp. F001]